MKIINNNFIKKININTLFGFWKTSGIFFLGSVLSKIINIILLPLYTSIIPTNDYGIYDVSLTYVNMAMYALFFEVWSTVFRYMYDTKEKQTIALSSGFAIYSSSVLVYILLGYIISFYVHIQYYSFILLYGFMQTLTYFVSFVARGYNKDIDFAISGVINTIITGSVNVFMLIYFNWDYSALYLSYIIGSIIQVFYLEIRVKCFSNVDLKKIDYQLIREMLIFTLPLGFNAMGYWCLTSMNKLFVNVIMTNADSGIYGICTKFSSLISFATTCFTYAWQSVAFSHENKKHNDSLFYSTASNLYAIAIGFGLIMLMPFIKTIYPYMVDKSYYAGEVVIPFTLFAAAMNAYTTFIGNILYSIKKTSGIFISTLVACILNVLLSYPMIKLMGLQGAAIAMTVSILINVIIMVIIIKKYIDLRLNFRLLLLIFAGIICSTVIFYNLSVISNAIWFLILFILLIVFLSSSIYNINCKN